jgi:hypothetical protein
LIRESYRGKRKRLNVTRAALDELQSGLKLEAANREDLVRLSASDKTLERTRELMLLSAERFGNSTLAGIVRDIVGDVLRSHPAFVATALAGVLENLPEALNDDAALQVVASQSYGALRWPDGSALLTKKQAEQCRVNAVCCMLLWLRETRGLSVERVQRLLHAAAWAPAARRQKTDAQKLRALMQARDRAALGIAWSVLEKEVQRHRQDAIAARDAETRAADRAIQIENQLTEVIAQAEAGRAEVDRLTAELQKARQDHENEKAHMRAEYEDLRGRVVRRLRQEVSLLDEGLHALKRQPPKVHVMQDHAERAIDGLKSEIDRIKED